MSRAGSSPRKASPSPGSRSSSPGRRSRTRRRPRGPRASTASPPSIPGPDYSVTTDLADYKTAVRSGVFVAVGGSATVDLVLEPGKPEEQAVAAGSLPAVDRKKMTAGAQFGWPELQTLPTTRDPWAVVALVPSVLLDRENVGGNESGRQPAVVAKGDASNGANNVWQIDGIDVTDPVAVGTSAVNFDFDTIDTIAVTTGGAADVTQQTGGVSVNMIGRRGGNKVGATARFYLTDEAFQSSNLINTLKDAGVAGTNRIEHVRDYGVSLGGPVIKNRIWLWGAYGSQDVYSNTIYNAPDRTLYSSFNFKLDVRPFAGNQLEAYFMASARERYGDNAEVFKPEGDHVYRPPQDGQSGLQDPGHAEIRGQRLPLPEVHPQPHRGPHGPHGRREPAEPGRLGRRGSDLCPLLAGLLAVLGLELHRPEEEELPGPGRPLQGLPVRDGPRVQGRPRVHGQGLRLPIGLHPQFPHHPELRRSPDRPGRRPGRPARRLSALRDRPLERRGPPGRADLRVSPGHGHQGPRHREPGPALRPPAAVPGGGEPEDGDRDDGLDRHRRHRRDEFRGHLFPVDRRLRLQIEIRVEHLVAAPRIELGRQGQRPDRAEADPGPVRRHHAQRLRHHGAARPRRRLRILVEGRGRRQQGRVRRDLLEVLLRPRRDAQPALRPLQRGPGASPRRRSPPSPGASRATPISRATTGTTTGRTTTPSTTTTSRPSTAATSIPRRRTSSPRPGPGRSPSASSARSRPT